MQLAVTTVRGEQRVGDQLGALLAGAYSLYSDNTISYEDALEWVRSHDWETCQLWRMEKSEMQKRHVLFQEEAKDSYVGTILTG